MPKLNLTKKSKPTMTLTKKMVKITPKPYAPNPRRTA